MVRVQLVSARQLFCWAKFARHYCCLHAGRRRGRIFAGSRHAPLWLNSLPMGLQWKVCETNKCHNNHHQHNHHRSAAATLRPTQSPSATAPATTTAARSLFPSPPCLSLYSLANPLFLIRSLTLPPLSFLPLAILPASVPFARAPA